MHPSSLFWLECRASRVPEIRVQERAGQVSLELQQELCSFTKYLTARSCSPQGKRERHGGVHPPENVKITECVEHYQA